MDLDRRSLTFHLHCSFSCFEPIFDAVRAAKLVSETRQNDIHSAGIQERILDIFSPTIDDHRAENEFVITCWKSLCTWTISSLA